MNTSNPSASYFDKVAPQWDNLRAGYFTEAVREAAIRKAYLHPGMTVADVGTGTGFIAPGLAPLVKACPCAGRLRSHAGRGTPQLGSIRECGIP